MAALMDPAVDLSHLTPQAARMLGATQSARFAFIERDKVIATPGLELVLGRLQELYEHHKILRPPNLALVGPSGIGKTHAITAFMARRKPRHSLSGELRVPVLHVEYPPLPSPGWYAQTLAKGLGFNVPLPRSPSDRFELIIQRLETARTQLIIVEEVNQLEAWAGAHVREFYGLTRWLSNRSQVPMVLSGTTQVLDLIQGDIQLVRRFERLELKPWACDADFGGFIKAYLRHVPLRLQTELSRNLIEEVHAAGQGITDTVVKVLQRAAKRAIASGDERILPRHVDKIAEPTATPVRRGRRK